MPDDPIQDNQDQTTSQPEPQPEESKPVEDLSSEVSTKEENPKPEDIPTPEPPKEGAPADLSSETSVKEENPAPSEPEPEKRPDEPKPEEPKQSEEKKSEDSKPSLPAEASTKVGEPEIKIVEKEVIKEIPVEVIKEVKVVDETELGKQLDEKFKAKLLENKKKANEARSQKKKDHLDRIVELAKKKEINNQDVRDLLQVSQSTATNYLTELTKSGRLKSEKKAKAKVYKS
ncbi:MAG: hypothetical protein HY424_00240 [Candidatus Levybacteria bacterium]|nr:hypothetical protein [Candidatus Levybacteria bacterium]